MTLVEELARIIANTNQPGRWEATGRAERDRRIKEAEAVLLHLDRGDHLELTNGDLKRS